MLNILIQNTCECTHTPAYVCKLLLLISRIAPSVVALHFKLSLYQRCQTERNKVNLQALSQLFATLWTGAVGGRVAPCTNKAE